MKGWIRAVLKKKQNKNKIDTEMQVSEHLSELRYRLIIVIALITVMTVFLYTKVPVIIRYIKRPIERFALDFAFFSMTEGFVTRFKLAFIIAVIILIPLILHQLLSFIGPGLRKEEKKVIYKALLFILPAFIAGAVFGYFMIVPTALNFLITFGNSYMTPVLSGDKYIVFIAMLTSALGVSFTIPVFMIFLGKLGILSSKGIRKIRKFILISLLIGEGIIVSDINSFILIAIPVILIFELSVLIVRFIEKRREKRNGDSVS